MTMKAKPGRQRTQQRKRQSTPPPTPTPSRLKALREASRLSLEDVAMDTGAMRSTVCRWESREREPQRCYRKAYAKCLRIPLGELGRVIYEDSVQGG